MADNDTAELSSGARLLSKIDSYYFQMERLCNFVAGVVIMGLMFLGVIQVVGRKVFNFPVRGYEDLVEFAMVVFAFLAISYCQRLGGHVRMEIIIGRFKGRTLWIFECIGILIAMYIIAVLMYYSYAHFGRAWDIGDSSIDIELPIWPSKLLVPFAFAMLLGRFTIQLTGYFRLFLYPNAEPVGIPLIETVDEQAQHEIDTGLAGEEEKVVITGDVRGR